MTKSGKKHTFSKSDLIDKLIDLRINKGYTRLSLLEFLTKDLEYSQSYSYELIQSAAKEFDERAIQNFGEDLKEDIERFESLYEKAVVSNNTKEARELLKEISKLKGHYKERIEISGEVSIKNIEIVIKDGSENRSDESI